MDKIPSMGMPPHPKKYPRGTNVKAWDAQGIPSSSTKQHVISLCAIFLLLHTLCVVLGASLFLFFVLFAVGYVGSEHICFEERPAPFNWTERSSFHCYCSASVLIF